MKLGNQIKIILIINFIFSFLISFNLKAENKRGNSVILGALDKITAKFSDLNVDVGESINFGSLNITIFECQKRPPEEIPEDFILLKIDDEINKNNKINVFSGWMLSSSPSLSSLEHSTYDVWAKECIITDF